MSAENRREQAAIRFYEVYLELQFERPSIKLRLLRLIFNWMQNYSKSSIFRYYLYFFLWTHNLFLDFRANSGGSITAASRIVPGVIY